MTGTLTADGSARLLRTIANMGFRGLGLVGRFALSIYLVKFLDLKSVGMFGLITGAIGLMPSVIGLGINYFFCRTLVGQAPLAAGSALKSRLLFSAVMAAVSLLIALLAHGVGFIALPAHLGLLAFLYLGEMLAFDIHMALINLKMPLLANALIFVRTSLWVFPFIALSYALPGLRNFHVLLLFWAGGLVFNYLLLFGSLIHWPWRRILATPVALMPFAQMEKKRALVYASDLGLAGSVYIDRFIVQGYLGIEATGIFVFFWTIANAVQVLVSTAVIQLSAPHLYEAYSEKKDALWRRLYRQEAVNGLALSLVLSVVILGGLELALPYLGRPELGDHMLAFLLLLVATNARVFSDMANVGLCCRHLDRSYAWMNIAGLTFGIALNLAGILWHGLYGLCWSLVITALALAFARYIILARDLRRGHSQSEELMPYDAIPTE